MSLTKLSIIFLLILIPCLIFASEVDKKDGSSTNTTPTQYSFQDTLFTPDGISSGTRSIGALVYAPGFFWLGIANSILTLPFGIGLLVGGVLGIVDGPTDSVYQDSYWAMTILGSITTVIAIPLIIVGFVIFALANRKSRVNMLGEFDKETESCRIGLRITL